MCRCLDCGCDLPSSQTLCSNCYQARYAELDRPMSLLEAIRQPGCNTRRAQVTENRVKAQPRWIAWGFALIGLVLDWRCAFDWFAGKSSAFSEMVLGKTALIVLACAGVSLVLVCFVRTAKWRDSLFLFTVFSLAVYRFLKQPLDRYPQ